MKQFFNRFKDIKFTGEAIITVMFVVAAPFVVMKAGERINEEPPYKQVTNSNLSLENTDGVTYQIKRIEGQEYIIFRSKEGLSVLKVNH